MNRTYILALILMSLFSCQSETYQAQDCDLIFRVAEMTDFSKAITDATAQTSEIKFDHVGIILIEDGKPKIVEATSKKGVTLTDFADFTRDSSAGYVIKRVTASYPASKVLEEAKSHLGEPYDWSFLPDNGKMYCSELVYESFVTENGQKLFESQPMNFKDAEGNMPRFWTELFNRLGETIPQGIPGTNPNDLSKSRHLKEVYKQLPDLHE